MFEAKYCPYDKCQKAFLCYKKFSDKIFCDRCTDPKHDLDKCVQCDIKFRPLWAWSVKCRSCRGVNTNTYKKCLYCQRLFKPKKIGQKQCKFCIQPSIGKRVCQNCTEQFVPQFFTSKSCAVCLFKLASRKSVF